MYLIARPRPGCAARGTKGGRSGALALEGGEATRDHFLMGQLSEDEFAARLLYYAPWFRSAQTPRDLGARTYAVLAYLLPSDRFFSVFSHYWARFVEGYRVSFDAAMAPHAPTVFGRDDFWRRAHIDREAFLVNAQQWVLHFWQGAGTGAESEGNEVRCCEVVTDNLSFQVALNPEASDEDLVRRVCDVLVGELRAKGGTKEEQEMFRRESATWHTFIPQARLRLQVSPLGAVIAEFETKLRKTDLKPDEFREQRNKVVRVMLGVPAEE